MTAQLHIFTKKGQAYGPSTGKEAAVGVCLSPTSSGQKQWPEQHKIFRIINLNEERIIG